MATITDPPREAFRLSQLIYNARYRSMTIQVIAFILIMSGLLYLANNVAVNYERGFDFGFLWDRAGYDINQRLIPYTADDTHGRAALVGILNTFLVAVLGCITALIVGVLMGILRLSKNWIVAKLAAVYVEAFRNVPLLLWILLVMAIMTEAMDSPRDFRGEDPEASMILGDSVAVTNRGIYIPGIEFTRLLESESVDEETGDIIPPTARTNWLIVLVLLGGGIFASSVVGRRATDVQNATGVRPVGTFWKRAACIIVPPAIALVGFGAYLDYPSLQGFNFTDGVHLRNSLLALWFALSLYTGAFIAEIVRAGIMSVSKGQTEASFALGLRPSWTMNLVILPQALRVIIPPLISQFLNLTKNSSLAIAATYMDVRATLGGITVNQTGRELEGILLLGLFYMITSLLISAVMNVYNSSVALKER